MTRTTRTIVGVIVVAVVLVLIALAYIWFSGGSGAPSATLSAPTLAIAAQPPTQAPTEASTVEATAEATAEAATEAASNLTVFTIAQDQSQVSFTLNEILRGANNEVVGKTDQVAGQIGVDFSNPANSQIGEIRIDVRTLATDDAMRDRMIRSQILQSSQDQYEFVSFKPTEITSLPSSITIGTAFSFKVTGDLTIRTLSKPITFDVTVTPDSQTQISGKATGTIQRGDFNLTIPNVPMVASADEAVKLEIDFVATAAT
jgi:polyisoprenoid-binding protein YceI